MIKSFLYDIFDIFFGVLAMFANLLFLISISIWFYMNTNIESNSKINNETNKTIIKLK